MTLQEVPIPALPERALRSVRDRRYNTSDAGKERKARYKRTDGGRESRRVQAEREYLARPFIAWDGEGITVDGEHRYVLLQNSVGGIIENPDGLSTGEIFRFLAETKRAHPKALHIVYGGGYDFNFWLHSLARDDVQRVYRGERRTGVEVGKWRIDWRRGKHFRVSFGRGLSITVYDVLPFFQTTFVLACQEYLGDEGFYEKALIVENKGKRAGFRVEDLPEIRRYNEAELVNLVRLAVELRKRLAKVGLKPARWDGPGAIAETLLKQREVKNAQAKCPEPVREAARYAYAGGRFEVVRFGHVLRRAYEYDVNSAYPYALRNVPCLAHGRWVHVSRFPREGEYAMAHAAYRGKSRVTPGPLYRRDRRGAVSYPGQVDGWYWTPEILAAQAYARSTGDSLTCSESWVWEPDHEGCREAGHSPYPFDWIDGLYNKRKALKAGGDGAHVGIKLGLNSLYGKLAQQVGWWVDKAGKMHVPPFHQLEWAGYITATCRAMLLRAAMLDPTAIIAFETDALFSERPLPLPVGDGLGEWECTVFESLTYVQSGTYFGTVRDKRGELKEVARTRGVDLGTMTREHVLAAMQQPRVADQRVDARLTRFVGAGLALATDWESWCTWKATPKRVWACPPEDSKRSHYECRECSREPGIALGVWHETLCYRFPGKEGVHSYPFPVEWEPGALEMPELAELRESNYERDDGME